MKQILILLMVFIAFSCSKEESKVENIIQNDRLSFQNMQEFNNKYQILAKMGSKEDLTVWAQSKSHSTLLYSSDSLITEYSDALKTILNKDSEFELGDSIVWFNDGKLYAFPKNSRLNLSSLKSNPYKDNVLGSVNVTKVGENMLKNSRLDITKISSTNQHEFYQQSYQPCGGTKSIGVGLRKFVHELVDESVTVYPGPVIYSNLYLNIKLEWKGSGGWQIAGEQRIITVNVSGSAHMYMTGRGDLGTGSNIYIPNKTFDCSGNQKLLLSSVYAIAPVGSLYWMVTMNGTIYQYVKGDYPISTVFPDVVKGPWLDNGVNHDNILW